MENTQPTHTVSKPNQNPPTSLQVFAADLKRLHAGQVRAYLGGDKDKATKFMNAVIYSVQRTPKLLECQQETVFSAFMACAEFGLYPSSVAGEAFIIPYKQKAQFQLGYQGLITLGARGGISVNSQIVRKNDHILFEEGLNPVLEHKYDPFASEEKRGEPIGAYAVLTNALGQKFVKLMGKEAIMKIKGLSQAKDSEYSPWNSKQDPELWMWRKTVIKQAMKLVPKTEVLQKAIAMDNEGDSALRRMNLDAGGPAVGAASHAPELPQGAASPKDEQKAPEAGVDAPSEELPIINLDDEQADSEQNTDHGTDNASG